MKWEVQFDQSMPRLMLKVAGTAEITALKECLCSSLNDPSWYPGIQCLLDLRELEIDGLKTEDMHTMTAIHREYADKMKEISKAAIVVTRLVDYGLVRMFQGIAQPSIPLEVFYSMDEAVRWLEE